MKKLTVVCMAVCLLIALSACTSAAGGTAGNTTTTVADVTTTTTTATATTTTTVAAPTDANPTQQAPATTTGIKTLTRDQAIALALQAAELTRDQVFDLEAELDRERGDLYWEVDFETRKHEFSYDIHAQNGTVTKTERERND